MTHRIGRVDHIGDWALDNSQTLERFLAGVEGRAYRLAWIATNNRDDALDIVQDAMLRLVRRYGQRPEAEWGPLMHRILQSAIRDWHRRHRVRSRWRSFLGRQMDEEGQEQGDPLETQVACSAPGPADTHVNAQTMAQLDRALQALPLRQQQAFLLRQWEGLSVAATAEAMACSEGSVKTHYSRAVKSLKAQLEDYWQ